MFQDKRDKRNKTKGTKGNTREHDKMNRMNNINQSCKVVNLLCMVIDSPTLNHDNVIATEVLFVWSQVMDHKCISPIKFTISINTNITTIVINTSTWKPINILTFQNPIEP